jgi:antitoxin HicB
VTKSKFRQRSGKTDGSEAVMSFEYPFNIKKSEDGSYFVKFIDIEEAITCGSSIEECIYNAGEVLSAMLECRLEDNDEIPLPSKGNHKYRVAPSAAIQAALLIRANRQGKTLADLARTLGVTWPVAQRLENPRHSPSLKQLERAAAALGKRLVIDFK